MNTFWLKIAALVVVIAVAVVLIGKLKSSEKPQPKVEEKTFYDQVEEDKARLLVEPRSLEEIAEEPTGESASEQVQEQKQPVETKQTPTERVVVQPPSAKPTEKPAVLYFKPLNEIDKAEAERLLNVAVPGRSIGRLPMTGFKLMVDCCRQMIIKWPDSWYAYRAKQMLIEMPERFRGRYKITREELDISEFTIQRPGTEPFNGTVEEEESF
ncbi:MAG: hypothetical protein PHY02_03020 [Phycisphaerae bacterium]|nr:hypothetical protein [Phycisphaerae bacterium]